MEGQAAALAPSLRGSGLSNPPGLGWGLLEWPCSHPLSCLSAGDRSKMSLWNLVSHMPPEEFSSLSTEFPRSLRCLLAEWLENQPW